MRSGKRTRRHGRLTAAIAAAVLGAGLTVAVPTTAGAAEPTDAVVKLPLSSFSQLLVDNAHEQVFLTNEGENARSGIMLVYSFGGEQLATITTQYPLSGMALSDDGSALYVGTRDHILTYDTATLTQTAETAAGFSAVCGREVAVAAGRLYYTAQPAGDCTSGYSYFLGLQDGVAVNTGWGDSGKLSVRSDGGNRLVMGQNSFYAPDPFLTVFDATYPSNLVRHAERRFADASGSGRLNLKDMAISPDGERIAVADATSGTRLLNIDDLSDAAAQYSPLPAGATAAAIALSPDGRYLARGTTATGSTPDLLIQPADPADGTQPVEFAFEGQLDGNQVPSHGLEFAADGSRLFAVTSDGGYQFWLHIVRPPAAQYDSRIVDVTHSPTAVVAGEPVAVRGRLELDGPAAAEAEQISAVRVDADGTEHALGSFAVRDDGTFTVYDEPDRTGDATYRISYLGDLTHRPAEDVTHTVTVGKASSTLTLTGPAEGSITEGITLTGTFSARGTEVTGPVLTVRRTDKLGTSELTSVRVAADGTFTVKDGPRERRDVTYTVSWPGDETHEGAEASATVNVTK